MLKLISVVTNHHAFEVTYEGNEIPTVKQIQEDVHRVFPNWEAVGICQEHLNYTFNSWHRYNRCQYNTGSRFIGKENN